MNVFDVADELGDKLDGISGLRVYRFPPDQLASPAAVVGYPETITFDLAAKRGQDMITFPVFLIVDRNWDRASAEQFSTYTAGAGASSLKAVLQTGPFTTFHTCRVRSVSFSVITIAGPEFWAATFLVDVYGSGA